MSITPGPWTVGIAAEETPPTYLIGSNGILWGRIVSTPGRDAEADALAISEVPQLLEALTHIAHGMGNLPIEQMGPDGVHGINDGKMRAIYLEEYVTIARAVVAKATAHEGGGL